MLMIAMFFGALAIDPGRNEALGRMRRKRRNWLVAFAGFLALRTLFLIVGVGLVAGSGGHIVAYGLLVVFAMPAAMSAVPWTQKSTGNIGLCMGLIVCSLIAAPIGLMVALLSATSLTNQIAEGTITSPSLQTLLATPVTQLILFSIPVVIGLIGGRFIKASTRDAWSPVLKIVPAVVILLLNYCNASRVIPTLHMHSASEFLPIATSATALAVIMAMVASHSLSVRLNLDRRDSVAITYSSGMFNTGMAMVLVASWLPEVPALLIPILLFTLGQHVVAAISEKRRERRLVDQERCPRTMTTKPVSINEP